MFFIENREKAESLILQIVRNLGINITPSAFMVLYSLKTTLPRQLFDTIMANIEVYIRKRNPPILDNRLLSEVLREVLSSARPGRTRRISRIREITTLESLISKHVREREQEPKQQNSSVLALKKQPPISIEAEKKAKVLSIPPELDVAPKMIVPPVKPRVEYTKKYVIPSKSRQKVPEIEIIKFQDWYTISDSIDAFKSYFQSRYKKLRDIIASNVFGKLMNTVNLAPGKYEDVYMVVMVDSKSESKKGRGGIITADDEYGRVRIYLPFDRYPELKVKFEHIIPDCVVAVRIEAVKSKNFVIARDIIFPDIPRLRERHKTSTSKKVLIAADLHVGSGVFMKKQFENLIKFIRGEMKDEKMNEIAQEVEYILLVGDLVDGVGVYPQQKNELAIPDQKKQYEVLAKYLGMIPDGKLIICIPGNHDASTRMIPQPPISEEVAAPLYDLSNVRILSNPSMIGIDGVKILMYHGVGLERLSGLLNIPLKEPNRIVAELLRYRHLYPEWGVLSLAPIEDDILVIDEVPDVVLTAHLHIYSVGTYKGTAILSPGSFEGLTTWQRDIGISPTIGYFHVMDLSNYEVMILRATENTVERVKTVRI